MRVTMGMLTKQYSKNLNASYARLNYYNNRSTTFRKFDKFSEDPVAATQSYRLRKEYQQNSDYQNNIGDVENLFLSAQTSLMSINTTLQEVASGDCLQGITGTSGPDERKIIATKLRKVQESIVSTANAKFADRFIFGGSCTTTPPFTIGKSGDLLYRGADVTTGKLENGSSTSFGELTVSFGTENGEQFNGYTMELVSNAGGVPDIGFAMIDASTKKITVNVPSGATAKDVKQILGDTSKVSDQNGLPIAGVDFSKIIVEGNDSIPVPVNISHTISDTVDLKKLAGEKIFADIGLGLDFDSNGNINEQSGFNVAIPGLSFLGYGTNKDGLPNNIHSLLGKIADELESQNFSIEKMEPYMKHLETQQLNVLSSVTSLGVQSNYIETTKNRLLDNEYNINVKINDVEQIDPAEAIMDFKMQEFYYRAALQVGSKVIQPTFLDFMR